MANPDTTMTVRVVLSLRVDRDAWDTIYGTGTDAAAVRESVKSYLLNDAQQCAAADEGGIVSATLAN